MNLRVALSAIDLPRYKRLTKESTWIIVGQIASVVGALVLVRVLTEYLDKVQYGQLALGLTIAGFINQMVTGGLVSGIGRFYSVAVEKHTVVDYLKASAQLMMYASAVVIILGLVLNAGLLYLGYSRWIGLSILVLILSVLTAYNSAVNSILGAARKRQVLVLNGLLDATLKIIFVLALVSNLGSSCTIVVIAYIFSAIFVTLSLCLTLRRLIPKSRASSYVTSDWRKQIWCYSWPFVTWGIFGWAQQSAPRWALENFASIADVGSFTVISQLGYTPIQTVINFVMTLMTPILFARAGDASCPIRNNNVSSITNKLVCFGIGLSGLALILASLLHTTIFHLFVSEPYWSVSHYLPWFVFAGGIFVVAQIYASRLMALMIPQSLIFASVCSSIVGVISSYAGVYYFSLQGAVASVVLHALSYLLLVVLATKHSLKRAQM